MASWAEGELKGIDLGDRRRDKRAIELLNTRSARPTASIPGACSGWSETMAAYRFFDNDAITWDSILAPRWSCSRTRVARHRVVLMLQDTTELDFNGQSISGLGPLSYEAQRGLYVHPTYAVSADREPLGVLDAWMWAREPKDADGQRPGIKESTRWIEGYERGAELAAELPETRLVYVADRESDMIELMARATELGAIEGLQRAIALYLIVSWRIAMLMRFGRTCPDLPADLFFHEEEWHAAYLLNQKKPPADVPTLNQVLRLVASLGGFLARKGDGEPGVKTIWLGLQRVMDCAVGLQFMRKAAAG